MADYYRIGAGGTWNDGTKWSLTSGGAAASAVPGSADNAYFDSNATGTITAGSAVVVGSLNFQGGPGSPGVFAGTFSWNATVQVNGSLTISASMAFAGSSNITLSANAPATLTSAGKQFPQSITINGTGVYTLQDALSMLATKTLTVTSGGVNENGKGITVGALVSSNSNTRALTISGSLTLTGTGTIWNVSVSTGLTASLTGTINVTDTSATSKTVTSGTLTYGTISITGGGTGAVGLNGNSIIGTLTIGAPKTVNVANNISVTTLTSNGSAGNLVSLVSDTPGTTRFITVLGSAVAHYTTLTDINANAKGSIDARDNCTNGGNNHNVVFSTLTRPTQALVGVG